LSALLSLFDFDSSGELMRLSRVCEVTESIRSDKQYRKDDREKGEEKKNSRVSMLHKRSPIRKQFEDGDELSPAYCFLILPGRVLFVAMLPEQRITQNQFSRVKPKTLELNQVLTESGWRNLWIMALPLRCAASL